MAKQNFAILQKYHIFATSFFDKKTFKSAANSIIKIKDFF
jgi:hypothetical protein